MLDKQFGLGCTRYAHSLLIICQFIQFAIQFSVLLCLFAKTIYLNKNYLQKVMVTLSKTSRKGGLNALYCLTILTITTLASAQMFADLNYDQDRRQSGGRFHNDEEDSSSVDQLDANSSIWDLLAAHQKDFLNLGGFQRLRDQFNDAYSLLSNDPEARRQRRNQHKKKGALRSAQNDQEAREHQKMLNERERIINMLENHELPETIPDSNKIYEMWLEKIGEKKGIRRDDKFDLKPHTMLSRSVEDMDQDQDASQQTGRKLNSEVNPTDTLTIHRLEEEYPTECYNQGKLAKQTQKYYMCKSVAANVSQKASEPFRVTSETYQLLLTNYTDQYSCYTQNVETNACICPSGYTDVLCDTDLYVKCYINITEPAFYKGCEDKFEDSFYYLYSIPGFSPCFWYNFTESIDVSYEVICQNVDQNGLTTNDKSDKVGYPYRDVIREPTVNLLSQVSSTPETEFTVPKSSVSVNFDFRDMKYLSNKKRFNMTLDVTSPGTTEGTITLDLGDLQVSDASHVSRFIVGGRTFFEASVFGTGVASFTFRGFFDEEGYEEPKSTLNELKSSGWLYVIIAACILFVIGAIVLYCWCKSKKEKERQAKKQKNE